MQKPASLETPVEQAEAPPKVFLRADTASWRLGNSRIDYRRSGASQLQDSGELGLQGQASRPRIFLRHRRGVLVQLRAVNWRRLLGHGFCN